MTMSASSEQQKRRIAIIVLNWNAAQDTLSCLESLLATIEQYRVTLIVCDNCSGDDSVQQIKQWAVQHFQVSTDCAKNDVRFVLFEIASNSGYAAGNNIGIQYAIDHGFDYVWILNNDTVVAENALTTLLDCSQQHPDIACFGSTLVDYSRPEKVQCAGGCRYNPLTTVRTEIYHDRDLHWVENQQQDLVLDYVCGAAMFLQVEALRKVGMLNQQFFLYYEELDLAQRLKKAGYRLGWCKASIVRHRTSSSHQLNTVQQQILHYHENLSTLIYTWLHHRKLFVFAACFRLLAKIIVLPLTNRSGLIPSLIRAYYNFFKKAVNNRLSYSMPEATASLVLKKQLR